MTEREMKPEETFDILKDFAPPDFQTWKSKTESELKGKPFSKLQTRTYEGITLNPIYTRGCLKNLNHLNELPGQPNYIRGTKPAGYTKNGWEICQEIIIGDAEKFNEAIKSELSRGQNAISLPLDTAAQFGLDSDKSEPEFVGDCGVSVSGLKSFSRAVNGIDLQKYPIYIKAGFSSIPMLAVLGAYAEKNRIDLADLSGSVEADPIGFLLSNGILPVTFESVFNKMATAVGWSVGNAPNIRTIGVNGFQFNAAGANAVQELAYSFASAVEYINQLLKRGVPIDSIARSIRFGFGVGPFFFMEIAKFRAARVIWSNIIDAFGGSSESKKIVVHARTTTINQCVFDPYVNMLRTASESFSAVLGGVDSLSSSPFDESFAVSNDFSRRIARNTQIILDEEVNLSKLIDPAGGSFFIESLTKELADKAWKEFQKIDRAGGMLKSVADGYPQETIRLTAAERKSDIRKRKSVLVGINNYANPKEERPLLEIMDPGSLVKKRTARLNLFRKTVNAEGNSALNKLKGILNSDAPDLVDLAIKTVIDGATIGDLRSVLNNISPESQPVDIPEPLTLSADFDELKYASFTFRDKSGRKPSAAMLNFGDMKEFKPRADFSRGFFETAGFETLYSDSLTGADSALEFVKTEQPDVVVVCSSDDKYPLIVEPAVSRIKAYNPKIIAVLAGHPKEEIERYGKAGIDEFIYLGADAYDILSRILFEIGEK